MERIIIIALIELSLKQTINGLPMDLLDLTTVVDDIVQPLKERIIFAGVPLVPTNQPKLKDDMIMVPKPRSLVTSLSQKTTNQSTVRDNMIVSTKPRNYSARMPLEPANEITTNNNESLPIQPTKLTALVKALKRRDIFTDLSEHVNLTNIVDDVIYKPEARSSLSRLLSESTNLTNIDDDILMPPKPDNLFAVLPMEFANLTNMMDDLGVVERLLSESANMTRPVNDTTHAAKARGMLPLVPANITEVMDGIVRESKTRGIFGGQVPLSHQPKLNMVEDTARASKTRGIFAKIPQDILPEDSGIVSLISEVPNAPELGLGYSNQIAKLKSLSLTGSDKAPAPRDDMFKIPLATQPFDNYKLLVVTAPPEIQMSDPDATPWIIYVVFPQDNSTSNFIVPTVYFVNKLPDIHDKKLQQEPIIVIDPNRKVTGLKSNDIEKIIKFKSKLASTLDYNKS